VRTREEHVHQQNVNMYYARSSGEQTKFRPAVALMEVRTTGDVLRSNENLMLLNCSVNLMNRHYVTENFLDNHGRIEDVPLGYLAHILVGRNFYFPTGNEPAALIQLNWQQAFVVSGTSYVSYAAAASSLFGHSSPVESSIQWNLLAYSKLADGNTLVARVVSLNGLNWSPDRQLFLGSSSGLRGYNNFDLTGQKRLVYNIEDRFYLPGEVWIFRPGAALFVDGGSIWQEGGVFRNQQFHTSAGIGLRIENTKQQGSGVLRIDFAYNFDERKFGEIIISSTLLFSAFAEFGFISPMTTGLF
jgi:hypothetical protein